MPIYIMYVEKLLDYADESCQPGHGLTFTVIRGRRASPQGSRGPDRSCPPKWSSEPTSHALTETEAALAWGTWGKSDLISPSRLTIGHDIGRKFSKNPLTGEACMKLEWSVASCLEASLGVLHSYILDMSVYSYTLDLLNSNCLISVAPSINASLHC